MRYTYTYKSFPGAPVATWIDRHLNKLGIFCFVIGVLTALPFGAIGILMYNSNGHESGFLETVLLILAFVLFFAGGPIIRALSNKFGWTEKLARWERGGN